MFEIMFSTQIRMLYYACLCSLVLLKVIFQSELGSQSLLAAHETLCGQMMAHLVHRKTEKQSTCDVNRHCCTQVMRGHFCFHLSETEHHCKLDLFTIITFLPPHPLFVFLSESHKPILVFSALVFFFSPPTTVTLKKTQKNVLWANPHVLWLVISALSFHTCLFPLLSFFSLFF